MVAAVIVALAVVYRLSPRRVTSTEVLALVGVGFAMLWSNRFLVWWAPLATLGPRLARSCDPVPPRGGHRGRPG